MIGLQIMGFIPAIGMVLFIIACVVVPTKSKGVQ
jgi:hypothetical protein